MPSETHITVERERDAFEWDLCPECGRAMDQLATTGGDVAGEPAGEVFECSRCGLDEVWVQAA